MTASSLPTTCRLLLAASVSALLLAACGSEDDKATDADALDQVIQVSETDFAIDPNPGRVEIAGAIRISVSNGGEKPHSLAVQTPDGVVQTDTLGPGEKGDVVATLPQGTYAWFCPVGDHRERGMEGELVVGEVSDDGSGPESDSRGKSGTY